MSDDLNLDELEQLAQNWTLSRDQALKLIALARKGLDYQPPEVARAREIEGDKACEWYRIEQARADRYEKALRELRKNLVRGDWRAQIIDEVLEEKPIGVL